MRHPSDLQARFFTDTAIAQVHSPTKNAIASLVTQGPGSLRNTIMTISSTGMSKALLFASSAGGVGSRGGTEEEGKAVEVWISRVGWTGDVLSQLLILLTLKRPGSAGGEWEQKTASEIAMGGCLNTEVGRLRRSRREAEFEGSILGPTMVIESSFSSRVQKKKWEGGGCEGEQR